MNHITHTPDGDKFNHQIEDIISSNLMKTKIHGIQFDGKQLTPENIDDNIFKAIENMRKQSTYKNDDRIIILITDFQIHDWKFTHLSTKITNIKIDTDGYFIMFAELIKPRIDQFRMTTCIMFIFEALDDFKNFLDNFVQNTRCIYINNESITIFPEDKIKLGDYDWRGTNIKLLNKPKKILNKQCIENINNLNISTNTYIDFDFLQNSVLTQLSIMIKENENFIKILNTCTNLSSLHIVFNNGSNGILDLSIFEKLCQQSLNKLHIECYDTNISFDDFIKCAFINNSIKDLKIMTHWFFSIYACELNSESMKLLHSFHDVTFCVSGRFEVPFEYMDSFFNIINVNNIQLKFELVDVMNVPEGMNLIKTNFVKLYNSYMLIRAFVIRSFYDNLVPAPHIQILDKMHNNQRITLLSLL